MNKKTASIAWWVIALVFTLSLAAYQRLTGPTYPVRGSISIKGSEIKYRLIRSSNSDKPAEIVLKNAGDELSGTITYKRYQVNEAYQTVAFQRSDDRLTAYLPPEPPAGKLEYTVTLFDGSERFEINEEPVVIRFKGPVPDSVLLPHILLMFLAMLFSTRTGIEAIRKESRVKLLTGLTLLFFTIGGMILGPLVQKFAFDAYWAGWPFGKDLTDNKTLVAFIAWIIAFVRIRKSSRNNWWAILAAVVLLAVYLIPHSMFGSELDYSTGEVTTGE